MTDLEMKYEVVPTVSKVLRSFKEKGFAIKYAGDPRKMVQIVDRLRNILHPSAAEVSAK